MFQRFRDQESNELLEKYPINDAIKSSTVLAIGSNGENLGEIAIDRARQIAAGEGLDLVQVGLKGNAAVVKIMDFGKFLYLKKKELAESKKKQTVIQVKEIKIRPNIGDQDYNTKLKQAVGFFKDGKHVKFTLQFRGREIGMMRELGPKIFQRITTDLQEQEVGKLVEEKEQRGNVYWSKVYFVKQ